jgi:lambda family phage portal protein
MAIKDFFKFGKKKKLKRSYEGANTTRFLSDFIQQSRSADDEIRYSLRQLRDRTRELHRNNEYAKRFVNLMVTNIIGNQGMTLQNRAKDGNNELDFVANSVIESRWKEWSKFGNCTTDQKMSFHDSLKMVVQSLFIDGEVLVQMVKDKSNRYLFAMKFLDIDLLDEEKNEVLQNGNTIRMGVELEKDTDKPVAYHLFEYNPYDYFIGTPKSKQTIRVPADNILHIYFMERPNQTRGVPPMSPTIKNFKMLHGYLEAELVASRIHASQMGFITSPSGDEYIGDVAPENEYTQQMKIEAGTFQQLPAGHDIKTFSPEHPTSAFDTFVKSILRQISSGLNISYHSLANDLTQVNYSSIRQGELEQREYFKTMQKFIVDHFCKPIYGEWLKMAMTSTEMNLPMAKYDKFNTPNFQPKGFPWIDPLKEIQANIQGLKNGIVSVSDIASNYGKDTETLFEQIQADKKLAEKFGLDYMFEPFGMAMKDNDNVENREEEDGN